MVKIPLSIAMKLAKLMEGESFPYSGLKHSSINEMIAEGILNMTTSGRTRKIVSCINKERLENYLDNHFGIRDLYYYIHVQDKGVTRAEFAKAASDSKLKSHRTFMGFLVNSLTPISASINGADFTIHPQEGTYSYIHDFHTFQIPPNITVVGIENAENFRYITLQQHLFKGKEILFVSRYPQSSDLIAWLQSIPNSYLHFGDFDFAGIQIFQNEYQKYLNDRAELFIPDSIEMMLDKYGNKNLYDIQYNTNNLNDFTKESRIETLISLFHKYKKCLEQEVFIKV